MSSFSNSAAGAATGKSILAEDVPKQAAAKDFPEQAAAKDFPQQVQRERGGAVLGQV